MEGAASPSRFGARWALLVFVVVLLVELVFVAAIGTDIPFHDQWNSEGQWLYPRWRDGNLALRDLTSAYNEHRIVWTHLLNLALFVVNGQWDPLVQLGSIAVLRSGCVTLILWRVSHASSVSPTLVAIVGGVMFLPHLAWHSVLWGFESQVYFALGFSLLALAWLGTEDLPLRVAIIGGVAGVAGMFAMGPAMLVPVALLGLSALHLLEGRRIDRAFTRRTVVALGLLILALALRVDVPEHAAFRPSGWRPFIMAAARVLSWPHAGTPAAALVLNAPVLLLVAQRILRRRTARRGEDVVLLIGGWSVAIALATAWARGGSAELATGVPSRYVDFVVLLPVANLWCALVLAQEAATKWRAMARVLAFAWGSFLSVGWLSLSVEVMRGLVLPRARDREAPVRLMRAFQATGDPAVFAGQPLLLVPHPDLNAVRDVLNDPRLRGALPPSLAPERPLGPLSRTTRALLRRE